MGASIIGIGFGGILHYKYNAIVGSVGKDGHADSKRP